MEINSDSNIVEYQLRQLLKHAKALGAYVDPGVIITSEQGYLRAHGQCTGAQEKPIIFLPEEAIVPIDSIKLRVSDDSFVAESYDDEVPIESRQLCEAMLELYNETEKLRLHRKTSLWMALADKPEILSKIAAGRRDAPLIDSFLNLIKTRNAEQLIIDTYIKTRTLKFKGSKNTYSVLMPIIDFFDHHIDATGFVDKNGSDERVGIGVLGSNPIENSDDLLVRYGIFDSYDTWLVYGFVDNFAPFVRSVGLDINLGNKARIVVQSKIGSKFAGKLPQKLDDLKLFMPNVTSVSEGKIEVSHLLIPHPTRPFALKRILTTLIHGVLPEARPDELKELVAEANSVVIGENVRFYATLKAFVKNLDDKMRDAIWHKEVLRLCDLQISKIRDYENSSNGTRPLM